jgi:hypothetical protein
MPTATKVGRHTLSSAWFICAVLMHAKKPAMARSHNAFQNIGEELIVPYSYSNLMRILCTGLPPLIPPNARLIFDVEVLSARNRPQWEKPVVQHPGTHTLSHTQRDGQKSCIDAGVLYRWKGHQCTHQVQHYHLPHRCTLTQVLRRIVICVFCAWQA